MSTPRLDIFFGAADQAEARVYVQVTGEDVDGISLSGFVQGPACEYASTLRASSKLRDLGAGPTPLAEAIIPDPCFWTPDTPFVYAVQLEARRDGQVIASAQRLIGIRRLSARGANLLLDARRWVLRGVDCNAVPPTDLANWREAGAAMIVANPSEDVCAEASRWGVWLVAEVNVRHEDVGAELQRLGCWPAVAMVVITGNADESWLPQRPRNLLVAQAFGKQQPVMPVAWAQAMVCETGAPGELPARIAGCKLPVLVRRRQQNWPSLADARAGCDALQRDLATTGDYAGYIV